MAVTIANSAPSAAQIQDFINTFGVLSATAAKASGAVGDGVTLDQVAIATAISVATKEVYLSPGDYPVTSLVNTKGVEFAGPGRIVKAITGGNQQLNSYADKHKYVIGREYLSHWHKSIIAGYTLKAVFTGDSTTTGDSTSSALYHIPDLIQEQAIFEGYAGITCVNAGHGGQYTVPWLASYLSADLALNPDLYFIRWGVNDPAYGLTTAQFIANIRTGLATIRASKSLAQMSVVLMMPSSVSDTPNNRDEKWYESISLGMKQAARDFQCCFVDTYAYLKDSRNAADWMDDPYGDGRHIHPNDVMNLWIVSLLAEAIYPMGLRHVSNNRIQNRAGVEYLPDGTATLPASYPKGISIFRAASGSNWPLNGSVVTFNHADGVQLQFNYPFQGVTDSYAYRMGQSGVWTAWQYVKGAIAPAPPITVTPASGFTIGTAPEQMRTLANNSIVIAQGFVYKTTPAVLAANTLIATIDIAHFPLGQVWWCDLLIYDGSFEKIRGIVDGATGQITAPNGSTLVCSRVYIDHIWSKPF